MTPNATTQDEALLLVETTDGIATVTLNRPGQFNALSGALIDELRIRTSASWSLQRAGAASAQATI
jgi:1,4-dihydroxy-2-naphthoyl-CoA synthase